MKKRATIIVSILFVVVLLFPLASAGFFDFLKPTGKATTDTVTFSVSVTSSAPYIYNVTAADITLNLGPNPTYTHVNFSVYDSDGALNLNNVTAAANLSRSGEVSRFNSSCAVQDFEGDYANYTCLIKVWWFDGDGAWNVGVNISDLNSNVGLNTSAHPATETVEMGTLTGFEMYPNSIGFATLTPGTYNQTPTNYIRMNNTGNDPFTSTQVQINATDLRGEVNSALALWAGNFSAGPTSSAASCDVGAGTGVALANFTYTGVTNVVLNDGNYTINDGTGQEDMYLCLREVGAELSEQTYSSNDLGAWTVQVT
jgi:hypothetical protein